jgi:polyisoprenoid-binding protein YceI
MRAAPLLVTLALLAAAAFASQTPVLADVSGVQRPIDCHASKATFSVRHVFVERVSGTVPILSGALTLRPGSLIPLDAAAVLDPAHVDTGDGDRDASLESPDFFDAHRFPTWTFTSTRVVPESDAAFGIDGILTVHGVAQSEHLEVTVRHDGARLAYHAVGRIDRHAFGMAVTRLDPAIGGTVDVVLDLVVR